MAAQVKAALDEGRIEDDLEGIRLEKVHSKASTKQAMIARVSHQTSVRVWRLIALLFVAPSDPCPSYQPFDTLRPIRF
jgi:hypothetical protein